MAQTSHLYQQPPFTGTCPLADDGLAAGLVYSPSVTDGFSYRKLTNDGAFTFSAPAVPVGEATTLSVLVVNAATAGSVTFSGYDKVVGDSLSVTPGDRFLLRIEVINDGVPHSSVNVIALQ